MSGSAAFSGRHYTLERDNRELQLRGARRSPCLIIPLREIIGNYNSSSLLSYPLLIIPLREIIGNYNRTTTGIRSRGIIPLREIIGNYNNEVNVDVCCHIIPLREIIGNYNINSSQADSAINYTLERDNRELQPTAPSMETP